MTLAVKLTTLPRPLSRRRRREERSKLACIRQRPLLANPGIVVIDFYCHWHLIAKERKRESLCSFTRSNLNYTIPSHCLLGFSLPTRLAHLSLHLLLLTLALLLPLAGSHFIHQETLSSTCIQQKQQKKTTSEDRAKKSL